MLTVQEGFPSYVRVNSVTQRSPLPIIRRTKKSLVTRLARALILYVDSTAGALAGLRIIEHRVLVIDAVLRFQIVGVGCRPMQVPGSTDFSISRLRTVLTD